MSIVTDQRPLPVLRRAVLVAARGLGYSVTRQSSGEMLAVSISRGALPAQCPSAVATSCSLELGQSSSRGTHAQGARQSSPLMLLGDQMSSTSEQQAHSRVEVVLTDTILNRKERSRQHLGAPGGSLTIMDTCGPPRARSQL